MTHAMEMVAAAKLKRLQNLLQDSDRYANELRRMVRHLLHNRPVAHPLLAPNEEPKRTLVFLISSDTGLCGPYNTNILARTAEWTQETFGKTSSFVAIGRHGAAYLRRSGQTILNQLAIPRPQQMDDTIRALSQIATDQFAEKKVDEVLFLYTKVESLSVLRPSIGKLLPIAAREGGLQTAQREVDYLVEPSLQEVLELLLPELIEAEIGSYLKHSLASEQASRMIAMRQATDNAEEMIDSLTLARNKARQASITKELIEVVSGSRAMKSGEDQLWR